MVHCILKVCVSLLIFCLVDISISMSSVLKVPTIMVLLLISPFIFVSICLTYCGTPMLHTSVQFSSVAQSCPTLCNPMNCSVPGLPVHYQLLGFTQLVSIESVMPSNHLILCHPLILLPSIFPSIRVFSNESALFIRLSKYWSFSFNISPSNEHQGLISFRMD